MRVHAHAGSMKSRLLTSVLVVVMVCALTPVSALGLIIDPLPDVSEWYVDPASGSDGDSGTSWSTAFETISRAVDAADADDVIHLAEATYTGEFPVYVDAVGKAGVTFKGAGIGETVLDAEDASRHFEIIQGFAFDAEPSGLLLSPVTFEDMSLVNGSVGGGDLVPLGIGVPSDVGGSMGIVGANVELTRCEFTDNTALAGGAVASIEGSVLWVDQCVFDSNGESFDEVNGAPLVESRCFEGGAILVDGAIYSVVDSVFVSNGAMYSGAAVSAFDSLGTFEGCWFTGNGVTESIVGLGGLGALDVGALDVDAFDVDAFDVQTLQEMPPFGGIVSVWFGDVVVDSCDFDGNFGFFSAGVMGVDSQVYVVDSRFESNLFGLGAVANVSSDAIVADRAALSYDAEPSRVAETPNARVERCVVAGSYGFVSFLFVGCDQAQVVNTLAHHNSTMEATAAFWDNVQALVVNSTFADNDGDYSVIGAPEAAPAIDLIVPQVEVYNSILWEGYYGALQPEGVEAYSSNLWEGEVRDTSTARMPPNISEDPMFVSPHFGNYRLMAGSPCIDTGANITEAPAEDLDGLSRPVDGDLDTFEEYDMGAYEFFGNASDRLGGKDRYETAVEISADHFASARTVVLATGRTFADGLAASGLAGLYHAPLLLTDATSLPPVVAGEIERLGATKVIVVGGTAAVAANVSADLEAMGLVVERIGGADRYETAAMIADRIIDEAPTTPSMIFLARGDLFADALTASPVAFANWAPVLLVKPDQMPPATVDIISTMDAGTEVVVIGGEQAVGDGVAAQASYDVRISGDDRFATASAFSEWAVENGFATWNVTGVATGMDFPDALSGGAGIGSAGGVLLLTPRTSVHPSVDTLLSSVGSEILRLQLFGGVNAVSAPVETQLYGYLVP